MVASMEDKLKLAIHEAGHAAVGHALGHKFKWVSIRPNKKWRGEGQVVFGNDKMFITNLFAILLGGPYALAVCCNDWESVLETQNRADYEGIEAILSVIPEELRQVFMQECLRETLELIKKNCGGIRLLARELYVRNKKIKYKEACQIIEQGNQQEKY